MSTDLARAVERLRQLKDAIRRERAGANSRRSGNAAGNTGALAPGDRVFDPVTGQEGVIVGRTRENIIVHPRHG